MKKLDLGQSITILANVGVIAGIIFLAVELRQNNEFMAAEARFNRLSIHTSSGTLIVENPDLVEIWMRARNGDELTPGENFRLQTFIFRIFQNMNWTYLEAFEDIPLETWRKTLSDTYARDHWVTSKDELNSEFVQFMEENVVNER